jgi:hypothetical protein
LAVGRRDGVEQAGQRLQSVRSAIIGASTARIPTSEYARATAYIPSTVGPGYSANRS